jgi:hypothetical protein
MNIVARGYLLGLLAGAVIVSNLFKHKNAPAMLPEHAVFLMAES